MFKDWLQRSLLSRLTLFTGAATLLVWLALSISTVLTVRHEFGEMLDHRLQHVARMLLDFDIHRQPDLVRQQNDKSFSFAIYSRDGVLLASDQQPPLPLLSNREERRSRRLLEHGGQRWLVAIARDGERIAVVGERSDWQDELLEEILEHLGWPVTISALLLLGLLYFALRRALMPLQNLRAELAARTPNDLTPLEHPVPQEIRPLTRQLNQLFAAVSTVLARERRFTADAAHELRTPLAALQIQLEVAGRSPRPEARERAIQQALTGVGRTTQLVNQLLELARLEHLDELATDTLSLQALVQTTLDSETADDVALCGQSDLHIQGHAGLLQLLLRNLLDNARRYGAAPIRIELAADGLSVIDHGRGISPETLQRLGERFYRQAGQTQPGSGLGLSIVRRIAELHGAELRFHNHPEGGLAVTLSWPRSGNEAPA
ncbi:ATP-binding protein [Chitinilyticum piscinae]|uniref:histidine kinase n=1 Tax=Chitinilyticum piscinae TaxID=2866724 RepID=A0A8J7K0G0_9NEIS|nr:ATP-binding protein [Chitinilyticum piscinae]MBE9607961.1 hypothetical protein [Chitinilyticum piscinae]